MKILIVDDSAVMRKLVLRTFRQAGFEAESIVEASDGGEALARLGEGDFDLVFSDVNMPNVNGMELLKKLKADPKLADVPVVMVTTETTVDVVRQLTELGAKACISKPFTAESLQRVLGPILG